MCIGATSLQLFPDIVRCDYERRRGKDALSWVWERDAADLAGEKQQNANAPPPARLTGGGSSSHCAGDVAHLRLPRSQIKCVARKDFPARILRQIPHTARWLRASAVIRRVSEGPVGVVAERLSHVLMRWSVDRWSLTCRICISGEFLMRAEGSGDGISAYESNTCSEC